MLVGIDPDYVEKVVYCGATFSIRPLPFGKWARLRQENIDGFRKALTRAIASLKDEGLAPDDEIEISIAGEKKKQTRAALRAVTDGIYKEQLAAVYTHEMRWSLVAHDGIANAAGELVPFVTIDATYEGEAYKIVGPSTERWYKANHRVLEVLHGAIWAVNELEASEKKV